MTFEFSIPASAKAQTVVDSLSELQSFYAKGLKLVDPHEPSRDFQRVSWLRNQGDNGGGVRLQRAQDPFLNQASLNVSSVHYEGDEARALASATALSCIVHPEYPLSPSMHMHISWTDLKSGKSGWRMMADLNPSNPIDEHRTKFLDAIKQVFHEMKESPLSHGLAQGDQYFYIPSLERHRGVAHFYLEQWSSGDFEQDRRLSMRFGRAVIQCYLQLLKDSLQRTEWTEEHRQNQLAYHTLYVLQVLTLDRGTTSGILVHSQNDEGILGSLPNVIVRSLLESWVPAQTDLQRKLLKSILDALPSQERIELTTPRRKQLAQVLRKHYQIHPETQALLAKGFQVPPTVQNHKKE